MNENRKMPSLRINAILNGICSIMSMIFPLITYPYVTRILQVENLGRVNFASSTIGYFSLLAVLGITGYAAREGIQYRDDSKKLNQFCSELFTLSLLTTLFSMILLLLSVVLVPRFAECKILLAIYSTTILISPLGMGWLYTLEEDYLYITIKSIAIQLASLVMLFVFVRKPEDYYKYAALNAFSNVGANFFNFAYSRKYIKLRICKEISKVLRHLKACLVFFSSSIASSIYSNIDITMLGFFSTDFNIGIYSAAVKIYTMIKSVLGALMVVMSPRLTYYKTHGLENEFNSLISKLFKIMLTLLMPVVVGLIVVAKETVVVLCGPAFAESSTSLSILAVAVFFAMFASIVNGCCLLPCKMEKIVLKTTVSAAVVNLVTNFFAIPLFQQNGAAITTVLAEMVVLTVGWHDAKKLIILDSMKHTIITSCIGCAVIVAVAFGMDCLFSNAFIVLIAKVLVCAISYGICLIIMRNEIALEYWTWLLRKCKLLDAH